MFGNVFHILIDQFIMKCFLINLGEDVEAKRLAKKVRVLCWIMTNPKHHQTKAVHVKATWGSRCNILLFMSSESGKSYYLQVQHFTLRFLTEKLTLLGEVFLGCQKKMNFLPCHFYISTRVSGQSVSYSLCKKNLLIELNN
jgi:hypothetical protein